VKLSTHLYLVPRRMWGALPPWFHTHSWHNAWAERQLYWRHWHNIMYLTTFSCVICSRHTSYVITKCILGSNAAHLSAGSPVICDYFFLHLSNLIINKIWGFHGSEGSDVDLHLYTM
jgi:hypothetical protein